MQSEFRATRQICNQVDNYFLNTRRMKRHLPFATHHFAAAAGLPRRPACLRRWKPGHRHGGGRRTGHKFRNHRHSLSDGFSAGGRALHFRPAEKVQFEAGNDLPHDLGGLKPGFKPYPCHKKMLNTDLPRRGRAQQADTDDGCGRTRITRIIASSIRDNSRQSFFLSRVHPWFNCLVPVKPPSGWRLFWPWPRLFCV